MRIEVRSSGFTTSEALRAHLERRLGSAIARRADGILRLVVRMRDENGPRGGLDKRCRIEFELRGGPRQVVEAVAGDFYAAVDAASRRLGRAVDRALDRPLG
ncbi:HPF/RaiA family ribosome-associated protein [Geothrix alkalitolerans]|uniref:HPF/RaiA family ribosome-associated protein n=1 Tax=Geothrix alkalitolerans TaxID=2922724 RepID=UPI001FAF9479|nr:HPF/RaiA family ribosome-associated protein [Geothrix alkalitolerans]